MRESNEAKEMPYLEKCRLIKLENKNYNYMAQKWEAPYEFIQRIMREDKSFKKDTDRIKFVKSAIAFGATWEDLRIQGYLAKSEIRRYEKKFQKYYEQYHPKAKPVEKQEEPQKPEYNQDLFNKIAAEQAKNLKPGPIIPNAKEQTANAKETEKEMVVKKKIDKQVTDTLTRMQKVIGHIHGDPHHKEKEEIKEYAKKENRKIYDSELEAKKDGMIPLYPFITKEFGNRYGMASKMNVAFIIMGMTAAGAISKDKLLDLITK